MAVQKTDTIASGNRREMNPQIKMAIWAHTILAVMKDSKTVSKTLLKSVKPKGKFVCESTTQSLIRLRIVFFCRTVRD